MALLNFARTYQEVLTELNVLKIQDLAEDTKGDYVKLFFVGEGDIISHGVNYTPLFNHPDATITRRGLVPINTSETNKDLDFLRGDGSWAKITTTDLPIWVSGNYDNTTILNAFQVQQLVNNSFIANDAMRFKGVVNSIDDVEDPWVVGDTYRIGTAGTYFGKVGEVGDMLVCITSGNSTQENKNTHWSVVQTNIRGVTTIKINNSNIQVYSNVDGNVGQSYQIFGPSERGTGSQVLVGALSSAGTPEWATTTNGLRILGAQGSRTLGLAPATTSSIGGVQIDSSNGLNGSPTISVTSDGIIYLTEQNIINVLGYKPANPGTLEDALSRATTSKDGLAPMFNTIIGEATNANWLLGVHQSGADNSYGWYSIPETAFKDTWRKISIGGIDIEDSELQLNPSGDVCIKVDNDPTDNVTSISFGLSWWNISTGAFETV